MNRKTVLKIVLVLVGLLFTAGIYPVASILWQKDHSSYGDAMMLSLYVTLGIFLLMAARNPAANRSLIAFTAWSSFAHGAVMTVMALRDPNDRGYLTGVAILVVIGVALLALSPGKESVGQLSPADA